MLELIVVRHGQSIADIEKRFEGRADFELTDLGVEQAKRLASWIHEHCIPTEIISSPLRRASRTAEIIGNACGVNVLIDPDIMEWDNGLLAGMKRDEGKAKFPLPPGGRKLHDTYAQTESYIQFRARAESFLSKLLDEHDVNAAKRLCIVSHGGFINMLLRSFLKLPVDTQVTIATGDTGVHSLRITDKDRRIVFTNCQEHLRTL